MQISSRKSLLAPSFVPNTNAVGTTANTRPYEKPHDTPEHPTGAWKGYGTSRVASALAALAMAAVTMLVLVLWPASVETETATPAEVTTGGFHADKG
jgi:hypothetical protein